MGLLILIVFLVGVIWASVLRFKIDEDSWYPEYDDGAILSKSLISGCIIGILLTIWVVITFRDVNDTQATYYINGIVVKGGTNWLYVFGTLFLGTSVTTMINVFISAVPIKIVYMLSGRYDEIDEIERSRLIAILLVLIFFLGVYGAHWFYLKMKRLGFIQILWSIASIFICPMILDESSVVSIIVCVSLFFLPLIIAIAFFVFKKEITFNGLRVIFK